jgi:hypothetical protein
LHSMAAGFSSSLHNPFSFTLWIYSCLLGLQLPRFIFLVKLISFLSVFIYLYHRHILRLPSAEQFFFYFKPFSTKFSPNSSLHVQKFMSHYFISVSLLFIQLFV